MNSVATYSWEEPTRGDVNALTGPVVLEFGAPWCGHCQAITGTMATLLKAHPEVKHLMIEDGRGKPLGRSFRVKLWPTLVFLRDGQVMGQVARPREPEIRAGFESITR